MSPRVRVVSYAPGMTKTGTKNRKFSGIRGEIQAGSDILAAGAE